MGVQQGGSQGKGQPAGPAAVSPLVLWLGVLGVAPICGSVSATPQAQATLLGQGSSHPWLTRLWFVWVATAGSTCCGLPF